MRTGFMNESIDIEWLKKVHLSGVPIPHPWDGFRSCILQGDGDAPYAVNLYISIDPNHHDKFFRVRFQNDSGAYAECYEYDGKTSKPLGGLLSLN